MRRSLRAILLAALVAASGVSAQAQETITVTVDQARSAALDAWRNGDVQTANTLAKLVLEARPEDTGALLLLAATEPALGRPEIGRRAGARAWASTDDQRLRFEAAYYTSQAAVAEERFTTAQFWMRRAYQTAPTEEERDNVGNAFRKLRAASPWIARFSFDVTPSSNLNGGASSQFLVIDENYPVGLLSGTARALSGVRTSLQGELSYTLSQGPEQRTALTLNAYRTFNRLSEEAREIAPDAKGSDFDYGVAELVFSHRRRDTPFFLPDHFALAVGQTWYGLEKLDKVTRLSLAKSIDLTPRDRLRFTIQGEHRDPDREGAQDRQGRELRFDYIRQFTNGHLLALTLTGRNITSDDINQAYTQGIARIWGSMGDDLMGFRLSGYVEHSYKEFSDYRIGFIDVGAGREDRETAAGLSLHVDRAGYLGFTPVISLRGRWTESNISRFEAEDLGLSVGFRSAF